MYAKHEYIPHTIFLPKWDKSREVKIGRLFGIALEVPNLEKPFFKLDLWLPGQSWYFLCKNNSDTAWTLFSQKLGEDDQPVFRKPVGWAANDRLHNSFLRVFLNFPKSSFFLSLFPTNQESLKHG